MSGSHVASSENELTAIDLRNPYLAGLLAWLVPGLGHFYQKRYPKALIFFLCIAPMFVAGCALASSREAGTARNVYLYWPWQITKIQISFLQIPLPIPGPDTRFWWAVQAPLGIAAIPSGIQALYVKNGQAPAFGMFMAPPQLFHGDKTGVPPVLDKIRQKMPYYELGTYLTAIAGLMNLLVILDAVDGPFFGRRKELTANH